MNLLLVPVLLAAAPGVWESRAPMPIGSPFPLQQPVAVGSRIYAIVDAKRILLEYDARKNVWSDKQAPLPSKRHHFAVVSLNGKIYTIGGCTGETENEKHEPAAVVEEYDPATNRWRTRASLPEPRRNAAATALDGKIYVFSGENLEQKKLPVVVYDPASDKWTRKSATTNIGNFGVAQAVNGKIYVIGIWFIDEKKRAPLTQEYDPAADTFTDKAPFPAARGAFGSAVVNGWIYLAGGMRGNNDWKATVERYNPATDTWETLPDLPKAKGWPGVVALDGAVYVMGGVATKWDTPENALEVLQAAAGR